MEQTCPQGGIHMPLHTYNRMLTETNDMVRCRILQCIDTRVQTPGFCA